MTPEVSSETFRPSRPEADEKRRVESEEERRQRLEAARRRLVEIPQIPDDPNDPPDEEWMRGIDEMRPHRPLFKECY